MDGPNETTGDGTYSPSEAIAATGLTRYQFTGRAQILGIQRCRRYSLDEIYRIATYSVPAGRNDPDKAEKLKDELIGMFDRNNDGITIKKVNGKYQLVRR